MDHNTTVDLGSGVERLLTEIEAYLGVIDAMRREGVEPCWVSELGSPSRRLDGSPFYKEAANDR